MEQSRAVLIGGQMPDFAWLGLATLASLVLAVLGYGFFTKSKRAFADVL
jgi:lipopolysaccharide transport system permease protein